MTVVSVPRFEVLFILFSVHICKNVLFTNSYCMTEFTNDYSLIDTVLYKLTI